MLKKSLEAFVYGFMEMVVIFFIAIAMLLALQWITRVSLL